MPLAEPPASLDGFPEADPLGLLYRIHRAELEPVHFSSTGHGRFDLPAPEGTLYAALSALGAFLEVFRSTLIPLAEVEARAVATLSPPEPLRLADCTSKAARGYGITAAVHSTPDYELTQRWARAFRAAGFDGVFHLLGHDPSGGEIGIALFSSAPAPPVVQHDAPIEDGLIRLAQERFGVLVVPTPTGS